MKLKKSKNLRKRNNSRRRAAGTKYYDPKIILEEKFAEDRLKYRTLFESANDAIFIMGGLNFIQCNNKALKIFGTSKKNIIGSSIIKFSPQMQPDGTRSYQKAKILIKKTLAGRPQHFEWTHRKFNGELFDAAVSLNSFTAGGRKFLQAIIRDITQHRKNEAPLLASEQMYKLLAENINEGMFMLDRNFRYIYSSPSAEKLSGFTPEELKGKKIFEIIAPADIARAKRIIQMYLPGILNGLISKVEPFELQIKRKNGSILTAEISISAYRGKDGKLAGFAGISRDISEKVKLQNALMESEKYFRAITEGLSDFILVYSREGTIKYASSSYARMVGYEVNEILGRNLFSLLLPGEREKVTKLLKMFVSGKMKTGNGIRVSLRHKNGEIIPVEALVRNMLSDPAINGIVVNGRDISERVKAEKLLVNSERYFRTLIEKQTDIIVVYDVYGKIKYVSPSYEKLTGIKCENAINKAVGFDIATPEKKTAIREKFRKLVEGGEGETVSFETDFIDINGKDWVIRITASNHISDPAIRGVLSNITDITEIRKSEQKLKLAVKELQMLNDDLEHFAYASYHDLQEPLRNVIISIQYLESKLGLKTDQDTGFYLQQAVEGAGRMKTMLSDILAYTKTGRDGEDMKTVDMNTIMTDVKAALGPVINASKTVIIYQDLPSVRGLKTQLFQVLQNLVSNAIKYNNSSNPEIEIISSKTEKEWVFKVKDNGIGMEKKYLEKIFVMFERLHTRSEYPGTGLGLALCKKIIERHGGRIWAESEPGKGSSFYFTLPF
jgi:PAS domain S-box-containing protein